MSVITGAELAAYMGETYATYSSQFDRAIESAELAVAAEIGVLELGADLGEDTFEIKTTRNVIEIKNGILRQVSAITIDGVAVDLDEVDSSYWLVSYTNGFSRGSTVVVSYSYGYSAKSEMPARMAEAILQTAAWMFTKTGLGPHVGPKVTSERIGDVAFTYDSEKGLEGVIPAMQRKMLQEFARVRA